MTTNFFCVNNVKKAVGKIVLAITAIAIASILLYTLKVKAAKVVTALNAFYYLVSEETYTQAGAYEVLGEGGAGYLLENDGEEYVAYSVYLSQGIGERVCADVLEQKGGVRLIEKKIPSLYFKSVVEKQKANMVVGALNSYYGCIQVLEQEIARLDKGATQESSKRILTTLCKQFRYLENTYKESYPVFSEQCHWAQETLQEIVEGCVYGKDLRFLLCGLTEGYLFLASEFSL